MPYKHIRVEPGAVATVALSRPEKRNAMDDETIKEVTRAFKALAEDSSVRAVVLRGDGPDFCAGADINWMRRAGRLSPAQGRKDALLLADMCRSVDECPVPVIGRAHGAVYGGGLGLISVCDIAIAADDARMCFSECRLGIMPAVISCFVLPKIGVSAARRYYLTAEVFGMQTAKEIGLISEVAPGAELDARIEVIAKNLLRSGPNAVRAAKAFILRFGAVPPARHVKLAVDTLVRLRSSPEGQEGLSAFLEKRVPAWSSAA